MVFLLSHSSTGTEPGQPCHLAASSSLGCITFCGTKCWKYIFLVVYKQTTTSKKQMQNFQIWIWNGILEKITLNIKCINLKPEEGGVWANGRWCSCLWKHRQRCMGWGCPTDISIWCFGGAPRQQEGHVPSTWWTSGYLLQVWVLDQVEGQWQGLQQVWLHHCQKLQQHL